MDCDILAGERGPSYSDVSQIKDWKVLHVRFIERHSEEIVNVEGENYESESFDRMPPSASSTAVSMQAAVSRKPESVIKSRMPASVPLSAMINMGKLIPPKPSKDLVTLQLEEFSIESKMWLDPFEVRLAVSKDKFDAYD